MMDFTYARRLDNAAVIALAMLRGGSVAFAGSASRSGTMQPHGFRRGPCVAGLVLLPSSARYGGRRHLVDRAANVEPREFDEQHHRVVADQSGGVQLAARLAHDRAQEEPGRRQLMYSVLDGVTAGATPLSVSLS
jgi:hypothetical protein